ncbi:MAG: diguanylate cyclase, partial [Desulfobulbaceae bacterium]|nr:diguanylate cyclase [Desulfobulbaceae bacterium]
MLGQAPSDFCARYGGEEFVVVLIDTDLSGATKVAQRIRFSVAEMKIKHVGSPPENVVTMSLGVAT